MGTLVLSTSPLPIGDKKEQEAKDATKIESQFWDLGTW